jgi:hypothetical protein
VALKNAAGEEYYTFGNPFEGTFDAQGHTVKNIHQRTWDMDGNYDYGYWKTAMGIFGWIHDGTVKNLIVDGRIGDVITASLKFRPYWIRYPLYSQNLKGDYPGADERYGFVAGDNYPQIVECFTTGHTLFMGEVLSTLAELSNHDIQSGVLPVPKLNKEQTEYYSTTTNSATAMAVPVTTKDTRRISIIIEAWAYESSKTLLPTYKENCMKGVFSQDLVTPEVLDEIFASASYDMGIYYNWGQLAARYRALVYSGSSDFTSLYRGFSGTAEEDIKAFVKKYS